MNQVESGEIIVNEVNPRNEDIEDPAINELVKGMMLLYEHGVFHGKVSTVALKAGNGKTRKSRHQGTEGVFLSMQLNLRCKHSHPKMRNMLMTIRVIISMLMQIRENQRIILSLVKDIPESAIAEYVLELNNRLFRRLQLRLDWHSEHTIEHILTDYIHSINRENGYECNFDQPIAVHFGDLVK